MASIRSELRRDPGGASLIFRLSNKILSQVFIAGKAQALQFALEDPNFLMLRSIRPSADRVFLTKIMKVCRLWREVALDTLELWSTIVLDSPQIAWSTKSFKRLKGAPLRLHIHYNQNMGEDNEFWALASAIMSENLRLLEVCIGWTSLFTTSNTPPLLQLSDERCAPLLENLKISIPGRHESHDPLPHLPWNNMPSLRILQLIVAKCPPLPPLPSLTRLYLGELGSHPVGCDISHFDLLRLLCGAPNLEVIEIAMPQQEVAVGQLVERSLRVPLDHLKTLSLSFFTDAQVALLRQLDFPSSTSILLASYPTDKRLSNDNVNLLGDIITRYVESLKGIPTEKTSLEIKPCDWDIYSFNIKLSTPSKKGDDDLGSCSDMIALTLPMPPNWFNDYSSILAALPLSSTATLHLSGFAFSTIFSLASGIKHLELSFFNCGGYVTDGAKAVAGLLSESELDFPCPELEVISISDSSSYPPSSQTSDQTAPQDMFGVLGDVVKERELWTPLRLIKLRRCWVEKEVLEELERIITVEQSSLARN